MLAAADLLERRMKSAETFLETLLCGAPAFAKPHPATILPPDIEFAALRGLKLAPIRGLSRFASAARSRVGYPTADLVQLRGFAAEFPMCNWSMAADGIIVLEYNRVLGQHSLCELCGGDWDGWRDTLQFRSGATRFLVYRHAGQRLRVLGPRSVGLRVYASGDLIPVPPSRFLTGPQLAWTNPSAVIQGVPWWLVEQNCGAGGDHLVGVPFITSFAGADEFHSINDDSSL
jgi:hypothetical protein